MSFSIKTRFAFIVSRNNLTSAPFYVTSIGIIGGDKHLQGYTAMSMPQLAVLSDFHYLFPLQSALILFIQYSCTAHFCRLAAWLNFAALFVSSLCTPPSTAQCTPLAVKLALPHTRALSPPPSLSLPIFLHQSSALLSPPELSANLVAQCWSSSFCSRRLEGIKLCLSPSLSPSFPLSLSLW